jgi:phage baseplate assembly protein W
LLTRKGERVMQPEFGTDIYGLLFSQITGNLDKEIERQIREQVTKWIPYIVLTDVTVDISNENIENNRIDIKIGFGLKRDIRQYDEIVVTFLV